MINVNNPPATQLNTSQHIITSNFTIPADSSAVVARYVKIAAGVTLKIAAGGDLKIL